MKVLVVLALCVALAQAGKLAVKSARDADLGNPWLVHLRIATTDSGLLSTCLGSLIGPQWVLTAASCVQDARFIWNRFNAEKLINPELVLEAGVAASNLHPDYDAVTGQNNIAYIQFSRFIHSTSTIAPVSLETAGSELAETGSFCGYGAADNAPGEERKCFSLTLTGEEGVVLTNSDDSTSNFDLGGPLIADGVQLGLLVTAPGPNDSTSGIFLRVGNYYEWLAEATNNFGATEEEEEE